MLRTRKLLWRAGAFLAVGVGVLSFTGGAAYALPRQCVEIQSDYHTASDLSSYWYGQYQSDLSTNIDYAISVDYSNYQYYENQRVSLAQTIMDYC